MILTQLKPNLLYFISQCDNHLDPIHSMGSIFEWPQVQNSCISLECTGLDENNRKAVWTGQIEGRILSAMGRLLCQVRKWEKSSLFSYYRYLERINISTEDFCFFNCRFLQSYDEQGVDIWGITTGNEPMNGFIPMWPFNCMGWTSSMMRKFLANNLGPSLKAANLDPQVIMLDDNKMSVSSWAREVRSISNWIVC